MSIAGKRRKSLMLFARKGKCFLSPPPEVGYLLVLPPIVSPVADGGELCSIAVHVVHWL